jgi:hypothetical protein
MSDQTAPGDQGSSHQQETGQDWKARFDGAIRKIEQLTLENRRLNDELVAKTADLEQSRSQLSLKDAEKLAAVGERDKRLQEAVQAKTTLESQVAELQALQLKVNVAKKMGRPDLLQILDSVPAMSDEAALENVLKTFADFADGKVRAREKELLAGITPPYGGGGTPLPAAPASDADWTQFIESKPLGSPERAAAMDDYWNFKMKQGA